MFVGLYCVDGGPTIACLPCLSCFSCLPWLIVYHLTVRRGGSRTQPTGPPAGPPERFHRRCLPKLPTGPGERPKTSLKQRATSRCVFNDQIRWQRSTMFATSHEQLRWQRSVTFANTSDVCNDQQHLQRPVTFETISSVCNRQLRLQRPATCA